MRVAIITESFPPDVNGVAHCVLRVAELLATGGHHPLVIAPQPPRAVRDEKTSYPFPVVRVPAVPLPGYPGFRLGLPGRRVRAAPTRLAEVHWMATKGTSWLVRRSRDLVPALMGLAVREWLGLGREEPEPETTEPKYPEPENTGPESTGAESTTLERVNLNVLSKPSGNLQLYEC